MIRALLITLTLVAAVPAISQEFDPCDVLLSGSQEQVYHAFFQSYQRNYTDGLGERGFMGSAIPKTPQTDLIALEYGLVWWGMKFNIVPSIEEAIKHRQQAHEMHRKKGTLYTDVLVAGLYIIGQESELQLDFDKEGAGAFFKPIPPDKILMMMQRGAYEVQPDGTYILIPAERLLRRVSLEGMTYNKVAHLPGAGGYNSISQSGWVAFKQHGLHDYSAWKQTDNARRLKKLARKLVEQGYTIRFNTDYKLMLDKLRDQKRTYRPEKKEGEDSKPERAEANPEYNRYRNEAVYNTALGNLLAGKGYSVGVYNPQGQLVAGEIGWRVGNHVYGDSVFYDDDVNLAKIAALALMEVMDAAGQPYTDPGMITAYTGSMGAELVPFPEYLKKIKSGPKEVIPLPDYWNPLDEDYLQKKLEEVVRRRSQGITKMVAISRMPRASKEALAIASTLGLQRLFLNIVILPNRESIVEHATHADPSDMPIYLLSSQPPAIGKSAAQYLNEALSAVGTEVLYVHHPRFAKDIRLIDLKVVKDILTLDLQLDPPQWNWSLEGGLPQISVPVWAAPKR